MKLKHFKLGVGLLSRLWRKLVPLEATLLLPLADEALAELWWLVEELEWCRSLRGGLGYHMGFD